MKANELMIGDWVYNKYHKKPIQWNYGEMFCPNGNPVIGKDLEPIPLTAEILEKNGCIMVDKGDYGEWHIKENPNIPLWQHTEFIIFGGIEIHYVHELQHALRLCGLNELADNFQII